MGYGGVFHATAAYRQAAITIAIEKAVWPEWHMIFLRGIVSCTVVEMLQIQIILILEGCELARVLRCVHLD